MSFLDVDECQGQGNGNLCNSNAMCNNTIGSYTCTCLSGYYGDGFNCLGLFSIFSSLFFYSWP